MKRSPKVEQADGQGWNLRSRKFVKKRKARLERRKANADPEHPHGYGRYNGYLT